MSVEKRMDEFERVAQTKSVENVNRRMNEFEKVNQYEANLDEQKEGTLPFGVKRYKNCPLCGEFMEIEEIMDSSALYYCKGCKRKVTVPIDQ